MCWGLSHTRLFPAQTPISPPNLSGITRGVVSVKGVLSPWHASVALLRFLRGARRGEQKVTSCPQPGPTDQLVPGGAPRPTPLLQSGFLLRPPHASPFEFSYPEMEDFGLVTWQVSCNFRITFCS